LRTVTGGISGPFPVFNGAFDAAGGFGVGEGLLDFVGHRRESRGLSGRRRTGLRPALIRMFRPAVRFRPQRMFHRRFRSVGLRTRSAILKDSFGSVPAGAAPRAIAVTLYIMSSRAVAATVSCSVTVAASGEFFRVMVTL
jgi:hypothetical protein